MSDTLYTYLYSISKHNPTRYEDGTFVENWNYIYLDKNEEKGYPRYSATNTYKKLGISKSTYYRRMEILKKYHLISEEKDAKGRRYLKIPFIHSKMILPVKTCSFFTDCKNRKNNADDIIKLMAILKIYYYNENKYFTMRQLRIQMGYSVSHIEKDDYLRELLTILSGFNIVKWEVNPVKLSNDRIEVRYNIIHFSDEYNPIMEGFKVDSEFINISPLTQEEKERIFPIE